jgi:hypothetical protein
MPAPPRLSHYAELFSSDDPIVYILCPSAERPIPAGDTRRQSAWLFRTQEHAQKFSIWMRGRHGLESVPLQVRLRELVVGLYSAGKDLTYVIDPETRFGYGNPVSFKAPLPH